MNDMVFVKKTEQPKENADGSTGRPFMSLYSMGQLDFIRYDGLLRMVDELSVNVNIGMPALNRHIPPYFSILEQVYINLQSVLTPQDKQGYEARFDEMRMLIRNGKYTYTLVDDLKKMNKDLVNLRQKAGFGLVTVGALSDKERNKNIYGVE